MKGTKSWQRQVSEGPMPQPNNRDPRYSYTRQGVRDLGSSNKPAAHVVARTGIRTTRGRSLIIPNDGVVRFNE